MAQRPVYIKQEDEPCLSAEANIRGITIEKLVQTLVHEYCNERRTKKE